MAIYSNGKPIFAGEIQKAPGTIKNAELFCEYIMFTQDQEILVNIEQNDWLNTYRAPDEEKENLVILCDYLINIQTNSSVLLEN